MDRSVIFGLVAAAIFALVILHQIWRIWLSPGARKDQKDQQYRLNRQAAINMFCATFRILFPSPDEVYSVLPVIAQGLYRNAMPIGIREKELGSLRARQATNEIDADHLLQQQRETSADLAGLKDHFTSIIETLKFLDIPVGSENWQDHVDRPIQLVIAKPVAVTGSSSSVSAAAQSSSA